MNDWSENFALSRQVGVSFRTVKPKDMPFLEELYRSTRWEEVASTGWPEDMRIQFLKQQFAAQHAHFEQHYSDAKKWVLLRGKEQIGRLYLEEWPSQFRIVDIALMPSSRGSGLGTVLLQDIKNLAFAREKSVSIHVEKANRAKDLYLREGFVTIEDKGVYDLMDCPPQSADQLITTS